MQHLYVSVERRSQVLSIIALDFLFHHEGADAALGELFRVTKCDVMLSDVI